MKPTRRSFLQFTGAAIAAPAFSKVARAQTYPTRPITMIVSNAAGGTTDVIGRLLAERMRASLGQPVIIENVSGANGSIGTARAVRARLDGYTIDLGIQSTHVLNGAFYSLPYDLLNDFAPISPVATSASVLFARRTMPARDLIELLAWLKANPNKASAGIYTSGVHLLSVFLQKETGTQFTFVPYRGVAPATQDLVAGQIDLTFAAPDLLPLVRAGGIKAYAVTSDRRLALAPEIPTFAEMGLPTLSYSSWFGLFAPKGTPKDIIDKLNAAAVNALADPTVRARIVEFGAEIVPLDQQIPEGLGALVKADAEKWWPLIKEFGIKAE